MFNIESKIAHYILWLNPFRLIFALAVFGLILGWMHKFQPREETLPKLVKAQDYVDYSEKILASARLSFGPRVSKREIQACNKALPIVNQGLKLDPNNAQGLGVRAVIQKRCFKDYKAALSDEQKALVIYKQRGDKQGIWLSESAIKSLKSEMQK